MSDNTKTPVDHAQMLRNDIGIVPTQMIVSYAKKHLLGLKGLSDSVADKNDAVRDVEAFLEEYESVDDDEPSTPGVR